MTIGCIIQARMDSTRLPGKVMMKVDEKNPIIFYLISQLKFSRFIDKIIIATTDLKADDVIADFAKKMGVFIFRGDSNDVLDRYYKCAEKFKISTIVRITADNPLIDPTMVDSAIQFFKSNSYDFIANVRPRTFPQGTEVEIFSFEALKKAWKEATKPSEREHVTPYFYNNPNKFTQFSIKNKENLLNLRWTVDTMDDLDFVKELIAKIQKRPILMDDILDILKKEPSLIEINKNHIIDEGLKKSIIDDS